MACREASVRGGRGCRATTATSAPPPALAGRSAVRFGATHLARIWPLLGTRRTLLGTRRTGFRRAGDLGRTALGTAATAPASMAPGAAAGVLCLNSGFRAASVARVTTRTTSIVAASLGASAVAGSRMAPWAIAAPIASAPAARGCGGGDLDHGAAA